MMKSSKNLRDEDEEADMYDGVIHRSSSSSYKGEEMKGEGKGKGKNGEQKLNTHRSKHSEMEQRRRSKINERFQILRDLIPPNDQKRDKASLLLEVIEYIQVLQEKLQTYEGPYQGWSQGPTKLMPWRSHNGPAESSMDHSQVMKNGSNRDNIVVAPGMLSSAQNSSESDLGTPAVYKATDFSPGSATPMISLNVHAQQNMFTSVGSGSMPAQPLQDSVSNVENIIYRPPSQLWLGRPCPTNCDVLNGALNEQDVPIDCGSSSMSNAYSQGILNTLTHALQSSGVDLSQASILVQIDVGKRANSGSNAMVSSSKDNEMLYQNSEVMAQTRIQSFNEGSDQAYKRLRTENS